MTEQTLTTTPAPAGQANQTDTPEDVAGTKFPIDKAGREQVESWREREAGDKRDARKALDELKARHGYELGNAIKVLRSLEPRLPESERAKLYERGRDGRIPLNDPDVIDRLVDVATSNIPVLKSLTSELGSERLAIERLMRDKTSAYYKGPWADAIQLRYRDLLR